MNNLAVELNRLMKINAASTQAMGQKKPFG
jgi:hypothetical protein